MKLSTLFRRPSYAIALVVLLLLASVWTVTAVRAAQPQTLDERTHDVASQLQCPVCNGESVADASTEVAAEMRDVIRHKLAQGESEQQVLQYFHDNYGDTILENPPKQGFTLIIWIGPVVGLLLGLFLLRGVALHWRAASASGLLSSPENAYDTALSDEDVLRYRELLRRELAAEDGEIAVPAKEGD